MREWLESFQVDYTPSHPLSSDIFSLKLSVAQAEALFATSFHHYAVAGETVIRTERIHLPDHLHQHIEMIHPTTFIGTFRPMGSIARVITGDWDWERQIKHLKALHQLQSNDDLQEQVSEICNATAVVCLGP